MKKLFFSSMLLGGLMMASCSEDVMEAPVQEVIQKDYAQKFVEKFGTISPEQDWNMAELKTIKVNGVSRAASGGVKIYAKYQGIFRLVAHYENVESGELSFTAPKHVDEFFVYCNGVSRILDGEGVVDFLSSRTYRTPEDDEVEVFSVHEDHTKFEKKNIVSYFQSTSGGQGGVGGGQVADFQMYLNENGDYVTVYPIYWDGDDTNEFHVFGIYYDGKNGREYVPIYYSKQGDDLEFNDGNGRYPCTSEKIWNVTKNNKEGTYDIYSRGFDVTLQGIPFGFYVEVYDGEPAADKKPAYVWHSVAEDDKVTDLYQKKDHGHIVLNKRNNDVVDGMPGSKMMHIESRKFDYAAKDKEQYDDILFIVAQNKGEIITEEPQPWLIAVEDWGADDDYDFNDIVFEVSPVAGQKTVKVRARAAGGTFPAYVYFGETMLQGKEFHQWFGAQPGADNLYPMINTFKDKEEIVCESFEIEVPDDWTLATYGEPVDNYMGGFTVKVLKDGDTNQEITTITGPCPGHAPQMICVPGTWKWMLERKDILEGYELFGAWGSNYKDGEWLNPATEKNLYQSSAD